MQYSHLETLQQWYLIRCGHMPYARQPGTVLKRLNARQSENFTEFSLKTFFKLLESIKCFFSHVKRL